MTQVQVAHGKLYVRRCSIVARAFLRHGVCNSVTPITVFSTIIKYTNNNVRLHRAVLERDVVVDGDSYSSQNGFQTLLKFYYKTSIDVIPWSYDFKLHFVDFRKGKWTGASLQPSQKLNLVLVSDYLYKAVSNAILSTNCQIDHDLWDWVFMPMRIHINVNNLTDILLTAKTE
jgi:hypothetical protein